MMLQQGAVLAAVLAAALAAVHVIGGHPLNKSNLFTEINVTK